MMKSVLPPLLIGSLLAWASSAYADAEVQSFLNRINTLEAELHDVKQEPEETVSKSDLSRVKAEVQTSSEWRNTNIQSVGRFNDVLIEPPRPLPELGLLLMESTYGNRQHESQDPFQQIAAVAKNGGVLNSPAFTMGQAQALQHILATRMDQGDMPKSPIYLDSLMAIKISDIFCQYSDQHRLYHKQSHRMCGAVTYTRTVDESKAISGQVYPYIFIAGSGMTTGGRILHHVQRLLGNSKTAVQGGTRGANMSEGVDAVKIHGDWIPQRTSVEVISSLSGLSGLSGHGDYLQLTQWLQQSALADTTRIQLIHGDLEAIEGLHVHLQEKTEFTVNVSGYRDILRF